MMLCELPKDNRTCAWTFLLSLLRILLSIHLSLNKVLLFWVNQSNPTWNLPELHSHHLFVLPDLYLMNRLLTFEQELYLRKRFLVEWNFWIDLEHTLFQNRSVMTRVSTCFYTMARKHSNNSGVNSNNSVSWWKLVDSKTLKRNGALAEKAATANSNYTVS